MGSAGLFLLEESATLLELSLWRDNLKGEIDHGHGSESSLEAKPMKRARIDADCARTRDA
eukprot:scaffold7349_cov129-Skeletonema_dohrnii-CCMP3373.AAC.6